MYGWQNEDGEPIMDGAAWRYEQSLDAENPPYDPDDYLPGNVEDEGEDDEDEDEDDKPVFTHDCTDCTFLGRWNGHDLYFCPNEPTVISRFGDYGDYNSGLGSMKPSLARARERAVQAGHIVALTAPYSEVCTHLRVAGTPVLVIPRPSGMAQLYTTDGDPISFAITRGEAGLHPTEDRPLNEPERG